MEIEQFVLNNLENHSKDIVKVVSLRFSVSRQRAHQYIRKLVNKGLISKLGNTRSTKYFLSTKISHKFYYELSSGVTEDKAWNDNLKERLLNYPKNIYKICDYGFTEMFNNVIDHSNASSIFCNFEIKDDNIVIRLTDNGVGIFEKIKKAFNLISIREAILHLSKGKFTTDPQHHSGEGIFFSSRVFDNYSIYSSGMSYYRYHENDWLLSEEKEKSPEQGTTINMEISLKSVTSLEDIFRKYQDDDDWGFTKTIVAVALSTDPNDLHISRSQAKRLIVGLDRFKEIVLDFRDVSTVGQSFVDEIFRVFQREHPEIKIIPINTTPDVKFMIERTTGENNLTV